MFSGYSAGMCQMSLRCSMSQAADFLRGFILHYVKAGKVLLLLFFDTAFSSGLVTALVAEYTETPNLYP